MTNKVAFWFAIIILCIVALDVFVYEWGLMLTIFKLLTRASDWIALWRKV